MARRDKYIRQFDEKTGVLHVRPRGKQVPMSRAGLILPHPKAADLDEVFAKQPPAPEEEPDEP